MTKNQIIIVLMFLFFVGILVYTLWPENKVPQTEIPQPQPTPAPQTLEEMLKPGTVGEIEISEKTEKTGETRTLELPPVIFNTTAKILQIKSDRLIVQGDGSNFEDQKPRELVLIFTDQTITFEPGQKIQYQGMEGLKHLEVGQEIAISSPENIRGKTQFIVDAINKL